MGKSFSKVAEIPQKKTAECRKVKGNQHVCHTLPGSVHAAVAFEHHLAEDRLKNGYSNQAMTEELPKTGHKGTPPPRLNVPLSFSGEGGSTVGRGGSDQIESLEGRLSKR